MTTIEIVKMIANPEDGPACRKGKAFARKHPDPFKAIDAAMAMDENSNERGFLRWAVWQEKVLGWNAYCDLVQTASQSGEPEADDRACAEAFRKWLQETLQLQPTT